MAKQDLKDIVLARDEVILKNCAYLSIGDGDYVRNSSLLLTNKRFIHRSISKTKKTKSIDMKEVNINDIDSLDYGYTQEKNRINPIFVVLFVLLFAGGIAAYFFLKNYLTFLISLFGIILLVVGLLIRKTTSGFSIKVISYHDITNHLSLDEHKELDERKDNSRRSFISLLIIFIAYVGIAVGFYFLRGYIGLEDYKLFNIDILYIVIGVLSLIFLVTMGSILGRNKKNTRKVVKVNVPAKTNKVAKGKDEVDVTINGKEIIDLVNDMGALIIDAKSKGDK